MENQTKLGLPKNLEAALCYLPFVGWIVSIVVFLMEKDASLRFNSAQSLVLTLIVWLLSTVMVMTIILAVLMPVLSLGFIVLDIYLVYQTYMGKEVVLPKLGEFVKAQLAKMNV